MKAINNRSGLIIFLLLFPSFAMAQMSGMPSVTGMYLKSQIISALFVLVFGLVIGTFFSDKLREFRTRLLLVLTVICFFIPVIGHLAAFVSGIVLAYNFFRDKTRKPSQSAVERDITFGSAEWADEAHIHEQGLVGTEGIRLGRFYQDGEPTYLHYTGERHLLTCAPNRTGKGAAAIVPNLLTQTCSALVIDPKGENAMMTAARRGEGDAKRGIEGMGQEVHVLDPWSITGLKRSCINLLDFLVPGDPDIIENAMMLADALVVPSENSGGNESFFDEEAKSLLAGVILYVALDEGEKANRHLGRVRDIITLGDGEALGEILDRMHQSGERMLVSTAERIGTKDAKLRSSIFATAQSHTHFLESPRIRESLARSDFSFDELKAKKMTIYLVLPADRLKPFERWLRLMIQQAITANARNIVDKPEQPVLFILDEFPALGRLTMVEQAFGLMAGFGIRLWAICQDFSQIERHYRESWQTFVANAGVIQYYGSRDLKTAEYCSKLCGISTVTKYSFGKSIANAIGWATTNSGTFMNPQGSSSQNESTTKTTSHNYDVVQRNLANPDELMVLRDDRQLLFIEDSNPIRGVKVRWYESDELKPYGVSLHEEGESPKNGNGGSSMKPENHEKSDENQERLASENV